MVKSNWILACNQLLRTHRNPTGRGSSCLLTDTLDERTRAILHFFLSIWQLGETLNSPSAEVFSLALRDRVTINLHNLIALCGPLRWEQPRHTVEAAPKLEKAFPLGVQHKQSRPWRHSSGVTARVRLSLRRDSHKPSGRICNA